ncbi:MAG: aspartate kinase [Syntrophomonadaceae bacterium]|nr:aspartate kinase [Syntrophomonadaceae bacterium]
MAVIVQKFGGTSLATSELRKRVVEIIAGTVRKGYQVVVVVSAMGRNKDPYATDTLLNLLPSKSTPPSRELDLLMSCGEIIAGVLLTAEVQEVGIDAVFLNGEQAGVITDEEYGNAHILYVKPQRVVKNLENGKVVVVAGFQGVSENGEITTLGRGGSDTTASALGVALNAEVIEIFTDVDGIMTADPRIVDNARVLAAVTYNEICQLAREGAKVIHPRAVEIAMQRNIPLRVRSTFSDSAGTLVTNLTIGPDAVKISRDHLITGITQMPDITQIRINHVPGVPRDEAELKIFRAMALANISVDFISVDQESVKFTVSREVSERAAQILRNTGFEPVMAYDCAKVAVVGAAMTGIPGVMARVVEALTEARIPILQCGDSYTNIWCLVKREHMEKAVKALHDKFELGS